MSNYLVNDNGITRQMTAAETKAYESSSTRFAEEIVQQEAIRIANEAAKTSARAKLAALGLTEAEIAALVG